MPSAGYRYVAIAPYSGCDYVSCTNAVTSGSYYSSGCTVAGCNISKCGYGSNLFGCGGNSSGTCIGVTNSAKGYYHAVAGSSAVSTCASCDIGNANPSCGVVPPAYTMRCFANPSEPYGTSSFCVGFESNNHAYCYGATWGCLFGTVDCVTDADCSRNYTFASPKYDGGVAICATATGWQAGACPNPFVVGTPVPFPGACAPCTFTLPVGKYFVSQCTTASCTAAIGTYFTSSGGALATGCAQLRCQATSAQLMPSSLQVLIRRLR